MTSRWMLLTCSAALLTACGADKSTGPSPDPSNSSGSPTGDPTRSGGDPNASDSGASASESDASASEDSPAAPHEDAATEHDATRDAGGTPAPTGKIRCGAATCDAKTQVCCAGSGNDTCVEIGKCNAIPVGCSGSSSCTEASKPLCCIGQGGVACMAACAGPRICGSDADCTAEETCHQGRTYSLCVAKRPSRDAGR